MDDSEHHERRHQQPGRRVADKVAVAGAVAYEIIDDDVREIAVFLTKIQRGWKRWALVVGAVASVVSGTVGVLIWLGWTNASPAERFREHDRTMNAEIAALKVRTANLEEAVDLVGYMACVLIRRSDPAAVPPKCNDTSIRRMAPR